MGAASNRGKITQKPPGEIDEVDTLIDEFTAAGNLGIGAPFAFVAEAAAMAVAAADEHQFAESARVAECASLPEGPVIAVVEADADERATAAGGFNDRV